MKYPDQDNASQQLKIGRYVVQAEIGRGGMAVVYHAYDPHFDRAVAIKVLSRELLIAPTFRARFQREAKTIAALEHAAIVPVYDYGEEDGQPYLVMRFMTGGSLEERLSQGPCSLDKVTNIFYRLAPALDYAHSKGIVHRDMKPSNILFDQHGDPHISDFGIVKLTEATTTLTAGAIVGTPAYMSPEQGRGEKDIDGRADIYSMGAILFQMVSGKLPYEATTPTGQIIRHINDPIPNILETSPDVPPGLQRVIERSMAKKKGDRYGTVKEMVAALDVLATGPVFPGAFRLRKEQGTALGTTFRPDEIIPNTDLGILPIETITDPETGAGKVGPVKEAKIENSEQASPVKLESVVETDLTQQRISPKQPVRMESVQFGGVREAKTQAAKKGWLFWVVGGVALITLVVLVLVGAFFGYQWLKNQRTAITKYQDIYGMVVLKVPQGKFWMGSNDNDTEAGQDEKPYHQVNLNTYWIYQTEVTNAMYARCVIFGVCQRPSKPGSNSRDVYYDNPDYANYPVIYVSWFDAKTYCEWAGDRLPIEAEWEKAARGTDGRIYPWKGDIDCTKANYWDIIGGCLGDTSAVNSYLTGISPYGALNMSGNVWEWVADWYADKYYFYPENLPSGTQRVVRGGAWDSNSQRLRTANRAGYDPSVKDYDIGFRCMHDE